MIRIASPLFRNTVTDAALLLKAAGKERDVPCPGYFTTTNNDSIGRHKFHRITSTTVQVSYFGAI